MTKNRLKDLFIKCMVSSFILFCLLALGIWLALYQAISPQISAKKNLENLANHYAKLTDIRDFATFNGQDTYYSITGRDDTQQEVLLLLKAGSNAPELINLSRIIDKAELLALAQEENLTPEEISFGRYDNQLVWEVKSQGRYYLFDAQTGHLITIWG